MYMVGAYVAKCNPFKDGKAGCWWFKAWHPNLTVCMPQPLSYARATKEVFLESWVLFMED